MKCVYCGECGLVDDFMFSQILQLVRNFKEFVGRRLVASSTFSEPVTEQRGAYSIANVFSGSVATQHR